MRNAIIALILLLIAAPSISGELVVKNAQGHELRLYDTPCSHGETLALLKPEWRPKFKNARIRDARGFILFYGCWIHDGDDAATIILHDGAAIDLRLSDFTDPAI